MGVIAIRKFADTIVTVPIALVIGLLFTWWAGAAVFMMGLALVFKPGRRLATWRRVAPEDEKTIQEDEWYYYHYRLHHDDTRKD